MNKFALFLIFLSLIIVAGVIFYLTQPLQKLAVQHDKKRIDDLMKIAAALEKYRNDYRRYPSSDSSSYIIITASYEVPWGSPFNPYMPILPKESSPRRYVYWADPDNGYESYRLYTSLEQPTLEPKACGTLTTDCPNVPGKLLCGPNLPCNYGVSSDNVSP